MRLESGWANGEQERPGCCDQREAGTGWRNGVTEMDHICKKKRFSSEIVR